MVFQYLIYKKDELGESAGVNKELQRLFLEAEKCGISIREVGEEGVLHYLKKEKILPENTLIITAKDSTLEELKDMKMAAVAYKHEDFPKESLFKADILVEGFEEIDLEFFWRVYQRKHGIPWEILKTERCCLREITVEDLDDLYEMYAEDSMIEFLEPLGEPEVEKMRIKAYIENMYGFYGYGMWLIKDRKTDVLLGLAGFSNLKLNGEDFLEMGYAIRPSCQKKGYGREVCQALITYAKEMNWGYEFLHCFVEEGNTASVSLLKYLGFQYIKHTKRDDIQTQIYQKSL